MDFPAAHVDLDAEAGPHLDAAEKFAAAIDPGIQADAAAIIAQTTLSQHQQAILDFERRWWRQAGAKEQAIRDRFEVSPTRYYQTLNAILDLPQAQTYDPTLVHRLLRVRTASPRSRRLS